MTSLRVSPVRVADPAHVPMTLSLLGTYPPTQCGIATFTAATRKSLALARPDWSLPVIEVSPARHSSPPRSSEVGASWIHGDRVSFMQAVQCANRSDAMLVQHEFGIFNGNDGDAIIDFIEAVDVPIVTELHTVLRDPTHGQCRVISALARCSQALVVMSDAARLRLLRNPQVRADQIVVIPHGAHETPNRTPLSVERAPELLTWGLVGPGKGLERATVAVAELARRGVAFNYRIVGETHPKVRDRYGEAYRESLIRLAEELGVRDRIHFDATYRTVEELIPVIANADLVIIPYDSTEQVTSGVLVEAVASGRPIVATAFPHAKELLRDGVGIVVDHGDAVAMADAIESVITHPERAQAMNRTARRAGQHLLWPAVGISTAALVERVVAGERSRNRPFTDLPNGLSRVRVS